MPGVSTSGHNTTAICRCGHVIVWDAEWKQWFHAGPWRRGGPGRVFCDDSLRRLAGP